MAPVWAQQLLEEVAATHDTSIPRLSWRQSDGEESSGHYRLKTQAISIKAGSDEVDAHMVTLHEMAHHLAHVLKRSERGHGEAFYFICWALYLAYDVPLDMAVAREFQYKAAAERVLRKMGIKLDARERKAGRYGDIGREMKTLEGSRQRLLARAKGGGANAAAYRERASEVALQMERVGQTRARLKTEWQASAGT